MKKSLLPLALIFSALNAYGIVNIENMRSNDEVPGFHVQASLSVDGKNGNSQKSNVETGLVFRWNHEANRQLLVMTYEYGETSDVKDTQNSFAHLRHNQDINQLLSWEIFMQMESDEFKRLSLRALVGGGIRINLGTNADKYQSWLGLGAFRSKEELDEQTGFVEDLDEYATRANIYHGFKYPINEHSRIFNTLYYQPEIGDAADYRILEQLALVFDFTDNLSFKVSLDIKHDNEPPVNVEKTDTSYNTGIAYKF